MMRTPKWLCEENWDTRQVITIPSILLFQVCVKELAKMYK